MGVDVAGVSYKAPGGLGILLCERVFLAGVSRPSKACCI